MSTLFSEQFGLVGSLTVKILFPGERSRRCARSLSGIILVFFDLGRFASSSTSQP